MCGRLVDHHLFYKQSFIGTQPCLFTFIHGCIHVTRAKMNICNKTCSVHSVTQSCPTLCDAMDCSMPGFPVHHHLPELAHTHVYQVGDAMQPSHPLLLPSPPAFNLSQHQGLFKWVSCLHQVAKNYWSFSFSISPFSEYSELISFRIDWFDFLAVQGTLKSLLQPTVQKYQFFGAQLSL